MFLGKDFGADKDRFEVLVSVKFSKILIVEKDLLYGSLVMLLCFCIV